MQISKSKLLKQQKIALQKTELSYRLKNSRKLALQAFNFRKQTSKTKKNCSIIHYSKNSQIKSKQSNKGSKSANNLNKAVSERSFYQGIPKKCGFEFTADQKCLTTKSCSTLNTYQAPSVANKKLATLSFDSDPHFTKRQNENKETYNQSKSSEQYLLGLNKSSLINNNQLDSILNRTQDLLCLYQEREASWNNERKRLQRKVKKYKRLFLEASQKPQTIAISDGRSHESRKRNRFKG